MVFLFAFRPRASRAAAAADPWLVAGPARTRRHEGECRPPASRSFVNNTLRRFVRVAIVASTRTVVVRGCAGAVLTRALVCRARRASRAARASAATPACRYVRAPPLTPRTDRPITNPH